MESMTANKEVVVLTLTRKVGEEIRIGDDIIVVVKEIRRNQVRLGIEASREIPIVRPEAEEPRRKRKRAGDSEG